MYLGQPTDIVHDADKNSMTELFQSNTDHPPIRTKKVPVESSKFITIVERYHHPIRGAFNVLQNEARDINDDTALQMVIKSINDSTRSNGLIPTLIVYGAIPHLGFPNKKQIESTFARVAAL